MSDLSENTTSGDLILDVTGHMCPLPVLHARKKLMALAPGTLLRVLATDPVARIDMPHFCMEAGHELVSMREDRDWTEFLIRRGPDAGDAPS